MLTIRLNGHHERLRVVVAQRLRGVMAATCSLLTSSLWQFHLHIFMWLAGRSFLLVYRWVVGLTRSANRSLGSLGNVHTVRWFTGWLNVWYLWYFNVFNLRWMRCRFELQMTANRDMSECAKPQSQTSLVIIRFDSFSLFACFFILYSIILWL